MAKPSTNGTSSERSSKKRKAKQVDDDDSVYDIPHKKPSPEIQKSKVADVHPFKKVKTEIQEPSEEKELNTSKPSAVFKPKKGRDWTLSIALPGSFIANTNKVYQKYDLAGRISRAAAVFCVDEIIVFDDAPKEIPENLQVYNKRLHNKVDLLAKVTDDAEPWDNPDQFLYHLLAFLECPGHLRIPLFPRHPNLKGVGELPTLDMPHHMREDEWCQYREGVTLPSEKPTSQHLRGKKSVKQTTPDPFTYVNCGFEYPVRVDVKIPPGMRVTLNFADTEPPKRWPHLSETDIANLEVSIANPQDPREEAGYYWGYTIRKESCLSDVYINSPYQETEDGGYDVSIGTSERGVALSSIIPSAHPPTPSTSRSKERTSRSTSDDKDGIELPREFNHLLVVFGGVAGLEPAVAQDPILSQKGLTKETAHDAFDFWVDLVPGQGSRTIRTEEAVLLGLMGLRPYVDMMSADETEKNGGNGLDDMEVDE